MSATSITIPHHHRRTLSGQVAAVQAGRDGDATIDLPLTVRRATSADGAAVARLAALDSAEIPAGPLLLAESKGELRAALSLTDGQAIADPFHRTAAIVTLLASVTPPARARPGVLRRLLRRAR